MEHFQDNMIVLMVEDAIVIQMESQDKSLKSQSEGRSAAAKSP